MQDTDRREVNCWHGNKLYECEDPEHATPKSIASRGQADAITVVYYRGTAEIWTTITDRESDMYGGQRIETVKCPHRHRDWKTAEKCGAQLAIREARRRNKERGIKES
jgi:hypothetical protein